MFCSKDKNSKNNTTSKICDNFLSHFEEKKKKTITIFLYYAITLFVAVMVFCILLTKFKILSYYINANVPQNVLVNNLEIFYNSHKAYFWIIFIIIIFARPFAYGFIFRRMWKRRNFSSNIKQMTYATIDLSIIWLFIPVMINIMLSIAYDFRAYVSVPFWLFTVGIAFLYAVYGMVYYITAEDEENCIIKEEQQNSTDV